MLLQNSFLDRFSICRLMYFNLLCGPWVMYKRLITELKSKAIYMCIFKIELFLDFIYVKYVRSEGNRVSGVCTGVFSDRGGS